ncbi:MAG: hypothetical protein RMJ28_00825 [Nitrososphaerota archaeon]|nr:hypothetical protein [Candidatus Calditenuaceae archaeon]MDW8072776.1 hypothetical protein [Nitrososphaerota archaeon]
MRGRFQGSVAVIVRDNAKAVKVMNALRRLRVQPIWVTDVVSVPLTVKVAVASREEGLKPQGRFKTFYLEDYSSPDCLALQLALSLSPPKPKSSLAVAIDPGRKLGVAYVVDGNVLETRAYADLSAFEDDCRKVVECLGEGRRLAFYIGYRPESVTHELASRLKSLYPSAKLLLLPDEGEGFKLEGLSRDEEAALKIYFKAISENI